MSDAKPQTIKYGLWFYGSFMVCDAKQDWTLGAVISSVVIPITTTSLTLRKINLGYDL
jgi:hypothetical protein